MKTIITLALLSLSTIALASEKEFHCEARFTLGKVKHHLSGTITSNTSMADVVYSINGDVEFEASLLTKDRSYTPRKYRFYQQMILGSNAWIEGSYTEYALLMPENMFDQNRFEAIVRSLNDQGGDYTKLECFVEN